MNFKAPRISADPGDSPRVYALDAYVSLNAGDDLMLAEFVEANSDSIFVLCGPLWGVSNHLLSSKNILLHDGSVLSACCRYSLDGVVTVGGSMFMDRRNRSFRQLVGHRRGYLERVLVALSMRARGRLYAIVGCNIGPVETRVGNMLFRTLFALATHITVRDSESLGWLSQRAQQRALCAPDMVFSYCDRHDHPHYAGRETRVLGIAVMNLPTWSSSNTYLDALVAFTRELLLKSADVEFRIYGFQGGSEGDGDAVRELARRIGGLSSASCVIYDGDLTTFVSDIGSCDYFVTTRYHAMILSIALGIPFSVISYSRKIDQTLDDLGWQGAIHRPDEDPESMALALSREFLDSRAFVADTHRAALHALVLQADKGMSCAGGQGSDLAG